MNLNLDDLLELDEYQLKLSEYIHVSPNDYRSIPYFAHISYIDRDGSIKPGGFFLKCSYGQRADETRFTLKLNGRFQTLYPVFYHIFYKPQDTFNVRTESKKKSKKIKVFLNKLNR